MRGAWRLKSARSISLEFSERLVGSLRPRRFVSKELRKEKVEENELKPRFCECTDDQVHFHYTCQKFYVLVGNNVYSCNGPLAHIYIWRPFQRPHSTGLIDYYYYKYYYYS